MAVNPVKFGYVKESSIAEKVRTKALDEYDYVFTYDTKKLFIVETDLSVTEIKGSIQTYNSETDAIESLKKDTSTYSGQIISIKSGDTYKAYMVNMLSTGTWGIEKLGDGGGSSLDPATSDDIKDLFK